MNRSNCGSGTIKCPIAVAVSALPKHILFLVLIWTLLLVALGITGCGYFVTPRGPSIPVKAKASEFSLIDQNGETVSLDSLLEKGPAVLVFYRGHW